MAAVALLCASLARADDGTLRVGSKRFTESYILAEVVAQTAAPHVKVEHRQGLGNTAIVLAALKNGSIDLYPEYVGTIDQEILKHGTRDKRPSSLAQIRAELAKMGFGVAVPLGFNNTYALAVRSDAGIATLSDLARQPDLRFGLSHEFIGRADGWPGLARRYALPQEPRGLDHGIAYEALAARQVDVIDIYSTDAKIARYGLTVLRDDRAYFPRYDAVLLYRLDAAQRFPQAWKAIEGLEGKIAERDMIGMNAAAELEGQAFAEVARRWLARQDAGKRGAGGEQVAAQVAVEEQPAAAPRSLAGVLFGPDLARLTGQHVLLVALSVLLAAIAGIPLGVLAAFRPRLRQPVLALTGMLQTVPSLALLAMLIPLMGTIGIVPALVALFVYALLPIVRNTCTGILGIAPGLRQAALALGLTPHQRLWHIDLPLALPVILAGVKTAAVMSVGTATIAAFIGAGGYGERITTGLALNDNMMLLAGALPAAALALLTQGLFELLERRFVVAHRK
ncbi:ABC transporter permease/substrate-binding protein [Pseudoduganella umbonata]|nr:glycine betaine ABC transporter substrate-binding protein [Pseudoduganella umbonata]QCP14759.1 ABC transporter permease subunit [Pseudoduganella umbonata]